MQFEWDQVKSLINQRKHGLSFEEAVEAREERWQTFGIVKRVHLLMVAHTITEQQENGTLVDVIRIITARLAGKRERKIYEDENG